MTDWKSLIDNDFAVPQDRQLDEVVAELSRGLRSADPQVRDGQAYPLLVRWVIRGVLDEGRLLALGDQMAERFGDSRIQARTFAPLILDGIVSSGVFRPQWQDAFADWYPNETDLRGYDPKLGWLHAFAHGADLLGALGQTPRVAPDAMLAVAAQRLMAPTDHVLRDYEDDRLGQAIALTLTRDDLTEPQATGWLATIRSGLSERPPIPIPAAFSNTARTLRMVYLLADRGVRLGRGEPVLPLTHRESVKEALAATLAIVAPVAG